MRYAAQQSLKAADLTHCATAGHSLNWEHSGRKGQPAMAAKPAPDPSWQRLGKILEMRRVELDSRYSNLTLFAKERNISFRLAWDAEHAARDNYRSSTKRAIEAAYGWQPGSIDSVLAGRDPDGYERPTYHDRGLENFARERESVGPDLLQREVDQMVRVADMAQQLVYAQRRIEELEAEVKTLRAEATKLRTRLAERPASATG